MSFHAVLFARPLILAPLNSLVKSRVSLRGGSLLLPLSLKSPQEGCHRLGGQKLTSACRTIDKVEVDGVFSDRSSCFRFGFRQFNGRESILQAS